MRGVVVVVVVWSDGVRLWAWVGLVQAWRLEPLVVARRTENRSRRISSAVMTAVAIQCR